MPHFEFDAFFEPDCAAHAARIASQMRVKPEVTSFWIFKNNANSSHNASCWWPHHYEHINPTNTNSETGASWSWKSEPARSNSLQDQHPRTRTMASAVWMCAKGRSKESLEKDYDMPRYAVCAGSFHPRSCISAILDNEGFLSATNYIISWNNLSFTHSGDSRYPTLEASWISLLVATGIMPTSQISSQLLAEAGPNATSVSNAKCTLWDILGCVMCLVMTLVCILLFHFCPQQFAARKSQLLGSIYAS